MRARLLMIGLLLALAGAGLIIGCDSDSDTNDGPPASAVETPEGNTGPALEEPPPTTVASGGRTVEMGIGTFCWTVVCVDKIGPITKGTLEVTRGDRVVVAVPAGTPPLREVSIAAFPAGISQKLDDGDVAWQPDFDKSTELPSTITGQNVEFAADLAPGRYVLTASMTFQAGDVQYGVVLEVK